MKKVLYVFAVTLFFAACSSVPEPAAAPVPAVHGAKPETKPAVRLVLPDGGISRGNFSGLSSEVQTYLKNLAAAFSSQDMPFLMNQGEAQFEKEKRTQVDSAYYLAMLYRSAPFAFESPDVRNDTPALNPELLIGIEYKSWKENGPFLEIQGELFTRNGDIIPCKIMLVWRLPVIKIQGVYP